MAWAELGLSEAQRADIRKVVEGAKRDRLRKSTDLKIARMDLRSLLREEKVDERAVSGKLAEIQTVQGALLKSRVDSVLAMKRILTPEQQKKMGELRRARVWREGRPRMQMRGGRGFRPGFGSAPTPDVRDQDENEDEDPDPLAMVVR
jgi:Spy/CpxP family protein refolding chaperone